MSDSHGNEARIRISIHTLRVEGDTADLQFFTSSSVFQSTPSAWRVTYTIRLPGTADAFQSTPSAWRVTHPE